MASSLVLRACAQLCGHQMRPKAAKVACATGSTCSAKVARAAAAKGARNTQHQRWRQLHGAPGPAWRRERAKQPLQQQQQEQQHNWEMTAATSHSRLYCAHPPPSTLCGCALQPCCKRAPLLGHKLAQLPAANARTTHVDEAKAKKNARSGAERDQTN